MSQALSWLYKEELLQFLLSFNVKVSDKLNQNTLRKIGSFLKSAANDAEGNSYFESLILEYLNTGNKKLPDDPREFESLTIGLAFIDETEKALQAKEEQIYKNLLELNQTVSVDTESPLIDLHNTNTNSLASSSLTTTHITHTLTTLDKKNNLAVTDPPNNLALSNMPNNNVEKIPLIEAGQFSGLKSENVTDFLDQYELAATANNWSDDTKIRLFQAHLTSGPKIWYTQYKKRKENFDWETLKADFRKTYTYAAQIETLHAVMAKKIQADNEPALNFFFDIICICKKYNPAIEDKDIIRYFLQAVRPEYCHYLSSLTNETLDQVEANLIKAENIVTINSQNKQRYNRGNQFQRHYADRSDDHREHGHECGYQPAGGRGFRTGDG